MIAVLKKRFCLLYRSIADQVGLSYATLRRWRQRIADGQPAVQRPGPKKVKPLDIEQLKRKISALDHGSKRSRGTGRLYGAVAEQISRRDLNRLIIQARRESNRQRAAGLCRVRWLRPNLAWAMDDCKKTLIGGGSLNHAAVNRALSEAMVIPINSPVYTAPYNGAIEHTQGEFKDYLKRWQWKAKSHRQCVLLAETAAHDINHRPRRCLKGKTACRTYYGNDRFACPKRKRKAICRWIQDLAERISIGLGKDVITPTAWRIAAKQ